MIRFTLKSQNVIKQAMVDFGEGWQVKLWQQYLKGNEPITPTDLVRDDGRGPMPQELRGALLGVLHHAAGDLFERIFDPKSSDNISMDLGSELAEVLALIAMIKEEGMR